LPDHEIAVGILRQGFEQHLVPLSRLTELVHHAVFAECSA
jgi:hypothetical protein